MITSPSKRLLSMVLLGVLATPALRSLDFTGRHSGASDPAKLQRYAVRKARWEEKRERAARAWQTLLQAIDEGDPQTIEAAAGAADGDHRMKRARKKKAMERNEYALSHPPQIRTSGDFLAMLRRHLLSRGEFREAPESLRPHFGSGPCHAIPRPREGTTDLTLLVGGALA